MKKSHYRGLVILSLASGLIGGLLDLLVPSLLSVQFHEAQAAQEESMSIGQLGVALLLSLPGVVMVISATYGLYRFRPWAPRLALIGTAFTLAAWPAFGATGQSGLSLAFSYAASYAWGACLVLSHVEPCRAWFSRHALVGISEA
jgi:uncharacterized BrkB/YihY/UPF0761 family membrane protein